MVASGSCHGPLRGACAPDGFLISRVLLARLKRSQRRRPAPAHCRAGVIPHNKKHRDRARPINVWTIFWVYKMARRRRDIFFWVAIA